MNFVNISEQKESWQDMQHDTWCMMSVVEYFDWLIEQPVNQVPSTVLNNLFKRCHVVQLQ